MLALRVVALCALAGNAIFAAENNRPPNIILILADDLGWSDLGCYGGEIDTPNIDRLAAQGIRFTRFYNSAKCEPTRASLMSGQYWQDCGLGITKGITMGRAMHESGYATFAVGKWHLDGNPVDRGFDHYFGHLSGASDYFKGDPTHRLDHAKFTPPKDSGFYTTDANADYAIRFIEESKKDSPQKPYFLYLAFNAPHGPIQAWPKDIAKYRGKYKAGWDALRKSRYDRMIDLGVFKKDWQLPPRPATIPAWDSLSDDAQTLEDLRMAIYAAMIDRMDQAIGRVLDRVRDLGDEDNTLVLFLSDNGANPYDRGRSGTLPDPAAKWEYGLGWSFLSGTPFQHYKRNMSNGGNCAPCIARWPQGIAKPGTITDQSAHIIDFMPTFLDLAGRPWPQSIDGEPLLPLPGKSLRPVLAGDSGDLHDSLYFQLMDHRAIIRGNWKLVSDWGRPWSLYDLAGDRSEMMDLSRTQPERFKELESAWNTWWADNPKTLRQSGGSEPKYAPVSTEEKSKPTGPIGK